MANLLDLGFERSKVIARQLDITHPDPFGIGPFCRLTVTTSAPEGPGVYAWVVEEDVSYIGRASYLLHVVQGARLQRPYNDYTYVPASKVAQKSSPRVRVNGLLNTALKEQLTVTWWWLVTESIERSKRVEAELISQWSPAWNRTRPNLFG